jgi:hypothetical protein
MQDKYLVMYAYHETPAAKINATFFCKHAVFDRPDVDYILVSQSVSPTIEIPQTRNFKTIVKRRNDGLDFGAWSIGLRGVNLSDYTKFIFINDTVRGPFFPAFAYEELIGDWYRIFCKKLDDKTKLVGATINNLASHPEMGRHVQSMAFATDIVGMRIFMDAGIFDYIQCVQLSRNKKTFILKREIYMSKLILANNFQIDELYVRASRLQGNDIHYLYSGNRRLNPLEVMFIKTNRIDSPELREYTRWCNSK